MPHANRGPTGALRRRVKWIAGGLVVLVVAALGVVLLAHTIFAPPTDEHDGGLTYAQMLTALKAQGASVQEESGRSGGYIPSTAHFLTVNGDKITVYAFTSTRDASQDAARISPDGYTITNTDASGLTSATVMDYIAPPHWFTSGHVLVLYVGCDTSIMSPLAEAVGLPFAGSGTVANPCPEPPLLTPTP